MTHAEVELIYSAMDVKYVAVVPRHDETRWRALTMFTILFLFVCMCLPSDDSDSKVIFVPVPMPVFIPVPGDLLTSMSFSQPLKVCVHALSFLYYVPSSTSLSYA